MEINPDTNDVNVFRFCGEYFDTETGTVYLRARYYQASIGRFINRDSFAGSLGDPLSLNLYTYCANNPLFFIDPSGHSYAALPDGTSMSINSASDARHFNIVRDKQLVSLSSKALTSGKHLASDVVSASKNEYVRNKVADVSNAMLTTFKNMNSSPKSEPKPWYKRLVRNGANIAKKCVGGIESFTSQFDFTFSDGLDISVTLATLGLSVSGNYAIDTKGNFTLQYSKGKTFGTDLTSLGLTRSRTITDAMNVSQLLGEGASYGVSASKIFSCGVNIVQDGQYMDDPNINGLNLFGGIGVGQGMLPITIQAQSSQTYDIYDINIYEEIYDMTNWLIDWAEE